MSNYNVITDSNISLEAVYDLIDRKRTGLAPLEWYMMVCFGRWEIFQSKSLAGLFLEFMKNNYPEFRLFKIDGDDVTNTLASAIGFYDARFLKVYGYGITEDKYIGSCIELGRIITEFLIRYLGYSVVDHDRKEITTASEEIDERFMTYLSQGYTLKRLDKIELSELLAVPSR